MRRLPVLVPPIVPKKLFSPAARSLSLSESIAPRRGSSSLVLQSTLPLESYFFHVSFSPSRNAMTASKLSLDPLDSFLPESVVENSLLFPPCFVSRDLLRVPSPL